MKKEKEHMQASTFSFHKVLFTTHKTRQDFTVVRTKTQDDMRQSRETTITALKGLIAERSRMSTVEVAQKSASIWESFHFYISDVDRCAFDCLTYTGGQQQHAAWLFETASPSSDDPPGRQALAFRHACNHSEGSGNTHAQSRSTSEW